MAIKREKVSVDRKEGKWNVNGRMSGKVKQERQQLTERQAGKSKELKGR